MQYFIILLLKINISLEILRKNAISKIFSFRKLFSCKKIKCVQTKNRILDLAVKRILIVLLVEPLAVAVRNYLK